MTFKTNLLKDLCLANNTWGLDCTCNTIYIHTLNCNHFYRYFAEKCFEECGRCAKLVSISLGCGHTPNVQCHQTQNPSNIKCMEACDKILPCEHACAER